MNAIVKSKPPQKMMLLEYMADKYALLPDEFAKTVRATCGMATSTPEQFAAFLIVAKEYDLNPLLKEIYAFPAKGGGVVPIVSVDGWVNLVNSHPQCDGFDFVTELDDASALISYTCTMHRKDRAHPTVVTEYLSECIRPTDPWKMKHRMLRHKSFIQASRYAFGFAGIYDEDEGRVIAESDGGISTGPRDASPPRGVTSTTKVIEHQPAEQVQNPTALPTSDLDVAEKQGANETAPEPRDIVPEPGKTNSYEGWATEYILLIETSPDKATMFKWIDLNQARLAKLGGSAEWAGKVKKATAALALRLDKVAEPAKERAGDAQGALLDDMGEEVAPEPAKRTRGAAKGKKAPDYGRDYDGWVKWHIDQIATAETPEAIETLFEAIDARWDELFPGDKDLFLGARREAEGKLEQ